MSVAERKAVDKAAVSAKKADDAAEAAAAAAVAAEAATVAEESLALPEERQRRQRRRKRGRERPSCGSWRVSGRSDRSRPARGVCLHQCGRGKTSVVVSASLKGLVIHRSSSGWSDLGKIGPGRPPRGGGEMATFPWCCGPQIFRGSHHCRCHQMCRFSGPTDKAELLSE